MAVDSGKENFDLGPSAHPERLKHRVFQHSRLKADMERPEIDFRFAPESGHFEAHAGLPLGPGTDLPNSISKPP